MALSFAAQPSGFSPNGRFLYDSPRSLCSFWLTFRWAGCITDTTASLPRIGRIRFFGKDRRRRAIAAQRDRHAVFPGVSQADACDARAGRDGALRRGGVVFRSPNNSEASLPTRSLIARIVS